MEKTTSVFEFWVRPTANGNVGVDANWIETEDYEVVEQQGDDTKIRVVVSQSDGERIRHLQYHGKGGWGPQHGHLIDGLEGVCLREEDYSLLNLCWMALYGQLDRITCCDEEL